MQKIAVIEMSCLFPGAKTPREFIENLNNRIDSTSNHSSRQMGVDPQLYYHEKKGLADKYYSQRGGYITDFTFDPSGYLIEEDFLNQLDDLYKWSLYVAKEALVNGGYYNQPTLQNCGLILGNLSFPTKTSNKLFLPIYHRAIETGVKELLDLEDFKLIGENHTDEANYINSRISGYPAALISEALGLSGPYFALDAACASSLFAVKLACDYLETGKADIMLAGAVSAGDPFFINQGFSTFTAYSQNDISCPLDKHSEGLISGEGAGMFLLKRFEDAQRDNDQIFAVISGIGLSNDGRGRSVLSPNVKGQLLAYQRAYESTDIKPEQVNYVECHATGTMIGDVSEIESLGTFFSKYNSDPYIGSVKANFGHLLSCAGMASMIKVILSMGQSEIPATINIKTPIVSSGKVVSSGLPWTNLQQPKIAAVNAFGFGGTNAHLIFEPNSAEQKTGVLSSGRNQKQCDMTIIGMDASFGACKTLGEFEQSIYKGEQLFTDLPQKRWKGLENHDSILKAYGFERGQAPQGAYIEAFEFDALHFKIPPKEVEAMIPQQLLMLKVADKALQDAQIREGENVGVIIAMESDKSLHQFRGRIDLDWMLEKALQTNPLPLTSSQLATLKKILKDAIRKPVQVNEFTSFIGNIMASRIAALWDFSGPAFTLSAEENSVYKALEVAQMMLGNNEVDAIVVGAVDLAGNFEDVLVRNRLMASVSSGKYTMGLESGAEGWMVGEGAGAIVLKRSDRAQKDQNRGYAVINAVSLNNGGDENALVLNCGKALTEAGIAASDVEYLELSGTVGNEEEEIRGLIESYQQAPRLSCAMGSVSANIGHTFVASGIASIIKTALCLHGQYIPAVPGWQSPKSGAWGNSAFYVATDSKSWIVKEGIKRTAAVNGTDADGTVAHVIMSENPIPQRKENTYRTQTTPFIFPLASGDNTGLKSQLEFLAEVIKKSENLYLSACENYIRFSQIDEKKRIISILGNDKNQLAGEISSALTFLNSDRSTDKGWQSSLGSYFTPKPLYKAGSVSFVYPGAFNSYLGMGRDLLRSFPELSGLLPTYTSHVEAVFHDPLVFPRSMSSLSASEIDLFQEKLESEVIPNFEAGINFAILHTALLRGAFGIQPDSAFGYSMGEVSMAFSLGLWQNTDKIHTVLNSEPLFLERLAGAMKTAREAWNLPLDQTGENQDSPWEAFIITHDIEAVKQAVQKEDRVFLLLINSPGEIVLGGEKKACQKFIQSNNIAVTPAGLFDIIHCELVKKEYESIYQMFHSPVVQESSIKFYTAANYKQIELSSHTLADNIAQLYCQTLDFPRLVNQVYEDGARIFIEIGPKNTCTNWIEKILDEKEHLTVLMDSKSENGYSSLLKAMARLICHGTPVDLSALYPRTATEIVQKDHRGRSIKIGGNSISDSILLHADTEVFRFLEVEQQQNDVILKGVGEKETLAKPTLQENRLPDLADDLSQQTQSEVDQYRSQFSRSHGAFLEARKASLNHLREMIKLQILLSSDQPAAPVSPEEKTPFKGDPYFYPEVRKPVFSKEIIWDENDLLEFAGGKIARVFGEEYAIIDGYQYRVRLPLPPYLLVNRVTKIDAACGEYKPSSLVTEYDIPKNAWYSIDGQIPWAIASEAGQCDLLLISFLGIDFRSKGERYYRLTDYTMTFFDHLPKEGDTLRYEIKIESFLKFGEALFFNFGYDCFVKDKLVYKMTGGRAGFTSDKELAQGKGIVFSKTEEQQRLNVTRKSFTPLLPCLKARFSRQDLLNISQGRIADCFGPRYDQQGANPSLRFASEEILMIDRIVSIDRQGGPWGLGEIVAEKDLAPDHWYFPCHFKDDNVLAGTLVTEGCVQLLGFYMLYLGLQINTKDARFQPIQNRSYAIRARGQIVPTDTRYSYKMEIIDIGTTPRPYARANFYIIMNDRILVDFRDLGIEMVEKSSDDPSLNRSPAKITSPIKKPLYDYSTLEEFATGSLEKVFGPEFKIYDNKRGPRIPNSDLLLVSRILELKGERFNFKEISEITTEYDVPADAWFFEQNSVPIVPYSIIMEIALQPSAFLSGYMGTTLLYPDAEMCYRNLSSDAELVIVPDLRGKTIVNKTRMLNVSKAAETVVMNFEYDLSCDDFTFYKGITQFGYFTPQALDMQKGLDRGAKIPPWFTKENLLLDSARKINLHSPEARNRYYQALPTQPRYRLAGGQLEFLDEAYIFENRGKYGKGYVFATKTVDPTDWFYPCHFFKDPVMPGSLGVEAILQTMRLFVLQQDLGKTLVSPYFTHYPGITKWIYRGQITPDNEVMDLEVHIKQIDQQPGQVTIIADANLWKNKLRIYQITDAAIMLKGDR
ncbi:3-hydroxyacyl-[acyl-carrier-protein] dehydratase FabA [bacterium]|nr:3-hydroxyacyl-[acyl-carrier-protein] dehydratase FabA [bacterium]